MKKWIIVCGLLVVVCGSLFGVMEYTSRPQFCSVCHQIQPAVASWQQSPHKQDADCLACHADSGLVGKVKTKIGSVKEIYIHFTNRPNPEDLKGEVPNYRCTQCHEKDIKKMESKQLLAIHENKELECASCHRDTAHGSATKVKLEFAAGDKCVACHTDESQIAMLSTPLPPAAPGAQG